MFFPCHSGYFVAKVSFWLSAQKTWRMYIRCEGVIAMLEEEELTYKIRGCVFEVYKELGAGFLEKVYENALLVEMKQQGLSCKSQQALTVKYKETVVGEYSADIVVEDKVILELKAVSRISPVHEAQLLNYLKSTGIKVGLLINFAHPKATVKRYVL